MFRVRLRVDGGYSSSPGVSKKRELLEAEVMAYRFQVLAERSSYKSCGITDEGGAACSALVVEYERASLGQWQEIVGEVV